MNKLQAAAAKIFQSFIGKNSLPADQVAATIKNIGQALREATEPKPVVSVKRTSKGNPRGRSGVPVNQYTIDGLFVKTHPSQTLAAKELGIGRTTIVANLAGKVPHAGGYVWRRLESAN